MHLTDLIGSHNLPAEMAWRAVSVVGATALIAVACDQDILVGVRLPGAAGAVSDGGDAGHGEATRDGGSDAGGRPGPGCFDGSREGFASSEDFPDIAACAGPWAGWVDEGEAASLCAEGWHVCRGGDAQITNMTYEKATGFLGCFAFDAAHDCYHCYRSCRGAIGTSMTVSTGAICSIATATDVDMAGLGANCIHHGELPLTSCLATGRLDSTGGTTGCQANPGRTTGVVCCRNEG